MKKYKTMLYTILALAFATVTAPAFADRGDIYGGIGIGKNSIDGGVRVFGGYTIYDQFQLAGKKVDLGAEATYIDLGSTAYGSGGTVTEKNLSITAVGSLAVYKDTRVFVRAGFGQAQGKVSSPVWNETKTGMVPVVGVGATYAIMNNIGVRADVERLTGMYEGATSFSASVTLKF